MENTKKGQVGSSSSLTSQLFGSQESSSSSNDIFASIFPPPKGAGRNSGSSEMRGSWQKEPYGTANQSWSAKQGNNSGNKEKYQHEGAEPCYMSSSLYYGGQETYSKSPNQSTSTSYRPNVNFKKDGGEDDPSGAARGNWWEGSLYY